MFELAKTIAHKQTLMVQSEEPKLGTCFFQTWSWLTSELVTFEEVLLLSAALLVLVGPIINIDFVISLIDSIDFLVTNKKLRYLTDGVTFAELLIINFYLVYLILFKSLIGAWPVLEVIIVLANNLD